MADFATSIQESGLNAKIATYSNPTRRPMTVEAADACVAAIKAERRILGAHPPDVATLAFTMWCESGLDLYSRPNVNGHPEASMFWDETANPPQYRSWDVGCCQLSLVWCFRSVFVSEYVGFGIDFTKALASDATKFLGDPIENLRLACRRLVVPSIYQQDNHQRIYAVKYTSPIHQELRGALYDDIIPYLTKFFGSYTP